MVRFALLIHARLDEDRFPAGARGASISIRTEDVRGRVVAYHVHTLQLRSLRLSIPQPQQSPPVPFQLPLRKGIRLKARLPENPPPELPSLLRPPRAHGRFVYPEQRLPEPALAQSVQVVLARPPQVRVREIELRLPVLLPAPVRVFRVAVFAR